MSNYLTSPVFTARRPDFQDYDRVFKVYPEMLANAAGYELKEVSSFGARVSLLFRDKPSIPITTKKVAWRDDEPMIYLVRGLYFVKSFNNFLESKDIKYHDNILKKIMKAGVKHTPEDHFKLKLMRKINKEL